LKRRQLVKHLKQQGCEFLREGTRHTLYVNPQNRKRVPIPRHAEIKNTTAREICKQLEIEPIE